jgi:hypothetical protein
MGENRRIRGDSRTVSNITVRMPWSKGPMHASDNDDINEMDVTEI